MTVGPAAVIPILAEGIALAAVIYRWRSFTAPWDFALSWSLIFAAIGLPLTLTRAPTVTPAVNRALHAMTGLWQLNIWLAQCSYMAALVALLYHALTRLVDVAELHHRFRWHVAPVVSVMPPVSLALLWASPAVAASCPASVVDVPIDGWLLAYWRLVSVTLIYLFVYCGWAVMAILIHDRRSRLVASMQFIAIVLGIICTVPLNSPIDPIIRSAATVLFAVSAAISWHRRMQWVDSGPDPGDPLLP